MLSRWKAVSDENALLLSSPAPHHCHHRQHRHHRRRRLYRRCRHRTVIIINIVIIKVNIIIIVSVNSNNNIKVIGVIITVSIVFVIFVVIVNVIVSLLDSNRQVCSISFSCDFLRIMFKMKKRRREVENRIQRSAQRTDNVIAPDGKR